VQGSTTIASDTWNGADELTGYSSQEGAMSTASYDGDGTRASAAFTPSGGAAVTQDYVWDGDILLMDSVNAYIYTNTGDARGTVNSSGSLTGTVSYDAWGNPDNAGGLTAITPFGYAGGYTDPDGLIYLINRYYDPATGQFISVDPEVNQTLEPYAYTLGDPVAQTDPTGLSVNLGQIASFALNYVFSLPYRFGDDCTDFASESLGAGGYQMSSGTHL
jgi:RHS repeat-associated protein